MGDYGLISVVTGCMFSGKTRELIRQYLRMQVKYGEEGVQLFKHIIDDRFFPDCVAGHDGSREDAIAVDSVCELRSKIVPDVKVVAIDEGQFFEPAALVQLCTDLAEHGVHVIVAGLDTDFRWEPFPGMATLMAKADKVTKLDAVCTGSPVCERPATRTQRLIDGEPASWDDPVFVVGADDMYEARCGDHHEVRDRPGR